MADKSPIRLAIAGLGRAGWGMQCEELKGREDKFRIVAACDELEERRTRMAARYGCRTYRDIRGLLADPEVEMVSVATRSCDHFAHALAALKAGKSVFDEKPMCVSHAEARKLQQAAARSKGDLYVRHNRRFESGFLHVREIIDSGLLGTVFSIKLRRNGYSRRDDWQTLKKFGGGQLLNWGPHIIDHALRFLGTPPVSMWSDLKRVAAVGNAEDHVRIVMRNARGMVVDLEISGGTAIGEPEYLVAGSRGALTCSGSTIRMKYLDPDKKLARRKLHPETPDGWFSTPDALPWIEKEMPVGPKAPSGMTIIWDYLYDAVRKGKRFPISLDEAVGVMEIVSGVKKGTPFA